MKVEQLKKATPAILSEINSLLKQLRSNASEQTGTLEELRNVVQNENTVTIVARDGDKIVGMGSLFIMNNVARKSGHIEDIVVDGAYRGRGLGEKIARALIDEARKRKLMGLQLTSKPDRVAGNKLYKKLGFEVKETNVYRLRI